MSSLRRLWDGAGPWARPRLAFRCGGVRSRVEGQTGQVGSAVDTFGGLRLRRCRHDLAYGLGRVRSAGFHRRPGGARSDPVAVREKASLIEDGNRVRQLTRANIVKCLWCDAGARGVNLNRKPATLIGPQSASLSVNGLTLAPVSSSWSAARATRGGTDLIFISCPANIGRPSAYISVLAHRRDATGRSESSPRAVSYPNPGPASTGCPGLPELPPW